MSLNGAPLPDEPVRMVVDFIVGDGKTRVDFGVKHPDEHRRDALPVLRELLTPIEQTTAVPA